MEGLVVAPKIDTRLFGSDFWLGVKYTYFSNDIRFDSLDADVGNPENDQKTRLSGLGVSLKYERFDNPFTPNSGLKTSLSYTRFDSLLGGTENYGSFTAKAVGFLNVSKRWVPGIKLQAQTVSDDAPFYANPFVQLRGAPAMRYQGQWALDAELENRISLNRRWSLVALAGVGHTSDETLLGNTVTETVFTYGGGIRYLLARLINMYAGFDIARSPAGTAFYIQFGKPMNW